MCVRGREMWCAFAQLLCRGGHRSGRGKFGKCGFAKNLALGPEAAAKLFFWEPSSYSSLF